jgi:hypothetical protein
VVGRNFVQKGHAVGSAGDDPIKVTVTREKKYRGRVMSAGKPVKEFRVEGIDVTSSDGRFEVPMTPIEDRLFVSIEAQGFEPLMEERSVNNELGDFELKSAPLISGVVKDENGAAVSDAVVTCEVCERPVLSGSDGRFSFGRPGYARSITLMAKKGRRTATKTVNVDGSQGVELLLQGSMQLIGRAFNSAGVPAAGIEIAGFHLDRNEAVTTVTNADGTYKIDLAPGSYRFVAVFKEIRNSSGEPPATSIKISQATQTLDFGPVPSSASLTVDVVPAPAHALFLVRGDLPNAPIPPMQLMKSDYAQMIFEPRQGRVVLQGLAPGRYTLVWGNFFEDGHAGVLRKTVNVPESAPVSLMP